MTSSSRKAFAFAVVIAVVGVGTFTFACSSNQSGGGGGNGSSSGGTSLPQCAAGGTSTVSTTAGTCTNPTIPIIFSPMYSAYIPGDTLRTFSIPAVTADGCPATWSLSDPSQAILHAEGFVVGAVTNPG